jgi:hypothetical protein
MTQTTIPQKITNIDWERIAADMHATGYAHVPGLLGKETCDELITQYNQPDLYRKTITMERYRFGLGEYKYFQYPLPPLLQSIRESLYPGLSVIANRWMEVLGIDTRYPATLEALHRLCRKNKQDKPTVLILKYGAGGHNTLHQDLYGELFFPIQAVLFLNEPGSDYTGGEFILLQQTPRAQSKALVLTPRRGDLLLFTTNFRPAQGSRGYYRVNMKHGVSQVHGGTRHTLGIIFHDAL